MSEAGRNVEDGILGSGMSVLVVIISIEMDEHCNMPRLHHTVQSLRWHTDKFGGSRAQRCS